MERNVVIALAVLATLNLATIGLVFSRTSDPPAVAAESGTDPVLLSRIEKLEGELAESRRSPAREFAVKSRAAGKADGSAPISARGRLEAVIADEKASEDVVLTALDSPDGEVKTKIEEMVQDQMEIAKEERWQKRIKRQRERVIERTAEFSKRVGLTQKQEVSLSELLTSEREEVTGYFRQARADFSFPEAREKAQALREETDTEAEALLDEAQYEEYQKEREEERARWGRGRGGRDRDKKPEPKP